MLVLAAYHQSPSRVPWIHRSHYETSFSLFPLLWFIFCSSGLKTAGGVLFLVSVTCFLALLSVNSDMIIFHYMFAGFNCVQVSPPIRSDNIWKVCFLVFVLNVFWEARLRRNSGWPMIRRFNPKTVSMSHWEGHWSPNCSWCVIRVWMDVNVLAACKATCAPTVCEWVDIVKRFDCR